MYVSVNPSTHTSIYIYTNVPCFDWKRPCFGGKTKDKWVPGIYIYIYNYLYIWTKPYVYMSCTSVAPWCHWHLWILTYLNDIFNWWGYLKVELVDCSWYNIWVIKPIIWSKQPRSLWGPCLPVLQTKPFLSIQRLLRRFLAWLRLAPGHTTRHQHGCELLVQKSGYLEDHPS